MRHRDLYVPPVWPHLPRARRRGLLRAGCAWVLVALCGALYGWQWCRLRDAEARLAAVEARPARTLYVTDHRAAPTVRAMLPRLAGMEVRP